MSESNLFVQEYEFNKHPANKNRVFCFHDSRLLLNSEYTVPIYSEVSYLQKAFSDITYIGRSGSETIFAVNVCDTNTKFENFNFIELRQTYNVLNQNYMMAAIYAHHIIKWNRRTKYCGVCGEKTFEGDKKERMKLCKKCNAVYFPKISPAIIVAIINDNKILLASHKRFKNNSYSVIAGFVEPGETLEECVIRETKEEIGIEIKNIRYFGSQPWPFPDSLMIGFIAEYSSGKIKADKEEITDARWFAWDEIPEWPDNVSIARKLIDWFINTRKN